MTSLAPAVAVRDTGALVEWMQTQRWFGAKGRQVSLRSLPVAPLAGNPAVLIGLAELVPADGGEPERYQLLLRTGDEAGSLAVADDEHAAAALARLFTDRPRIETPVGTVAFHWVGAFAPPAERSRPLGVEQSNSSFVLGDTHVMKIFRRLQRGVNPELEVLDYLGRRGFTDVAPLAGWYGLDEGAVEGETTLGVVQELVVGGLDGWRFVLDGVADDPGALLAPLRGLGVVLGRLHAALGAAGPDEPAFTPQPADEGLAARIADGIAVDCSFWRTSPTHAPAEVRQNGLDGARVAALARRLAAGTGGGALIRHHGDLHLGQTLLAPNGWVILDFEGEPARPVAERRNRHSPLRDVAGMLRSFAYAVATCEREGTRVPGGWEPAARAAFLDGWLATVDQALLPSSGAATLRLLALLELEKAVYELGYEMANRPEWADIPAAGIRHLLDEAA